MAQCSGFLNQAPYIFDTIAILTKRTLLDETHFTLWFGLRNTQFGARSIVVEETFESFNSGDAISLVSPVFELWPAAGATDAFVTDENQLSGATPEN